MKRRVRKIANFFAFNLLFFALYLNFIHKDKVAAVPVDTSRTAAFSGHISESQATQKANAVNADAEQTVTMESEGAPLRLSIN